MEMKIGALPQEQSVDFGGPTGFVRINEGKFWGRDQERCLREARSGDFLRAIPNLGPTVPKQLALIPLENGN
jgi:hypothetical protein